MEDIYIVLVIGILIFFGLLETLSGFLVNSKRKSGDWIQEILAFFVLSTLIKPAIVAVVVLVGSTIFPQYDKYLTDMPFIAVFFAYLLVDDLLQYWYHRSAHEHPFLWKLHRTHHQAEEMGFFVSYRNAALYYLLMPNIWWIGLFTFLGGGAAVALGLVIKQAVIIGSHSRVKWDKPFYTNEALQPLIRVLERIIVTPAFHHSHHGKSKLDSVSDPNGNFGNMFTIWDQLFGTALFTGKFPIEYGLQNDPQDKWTAAFLYPLVKSEKTDSELNADFRKTETASPEPVQLQLNKGEKYLWCRCGLSQNQPFCDASHHGTKFTPLLFEVKKGGNFKICNCKISKAPPFCDNSHLEI